LCARIRECPERDFDADSGMRGSAKEEGAVKMTGVLQCTMFVVQ
jgi:hypothetical protein